jgi:hypothetical protein
MANQTVSLTNLQQLDITIDPVQASGAITEGATVSNIVYTLSDETLGSLATASDGSAVFTPTITTVGTFTDTLTVTATVVDPDGTTGSFTAVATLTITVAPSGARTVGLEFNFVTVTPS